MSSPSATEQFPERGRGTALRACSCAVSVQLRADPILTVCMQASHQLQHLLGSLQVGSETLPHVGNTPCCGLGSLGYLPCFSSYLYSAQ